MQLANKKIIITGGASGMGAATVDAFIKEGATVFSLDINDAEGQRLITLHSTTARAHYRHCDLTDEQSVQHSFTEAASHMGGLDVLVHCAGIAPMAKAEDITLEQWENVFAVNSRSTFLTNKEAFKHMKNSGGRIINFASAAGVRGLPNKAHYSATKGAVLAWTRTIAQEWASYNITANCIAPAIATPMYAKTRSEMDAEQLEAHDRQLAMAIPLGGKLGDAEKDFAPVMVFIASDGSRFMTGQTFAIDGGTMMLS